MIIDANTPVLLLLTKLFFLIAFFVYVFFAGVVVRQVYLMTGTLEVGFETQIRLIAWIHFFVAVGVLLFALVVL